LNSLIDRTEIQQKAVDRYYDLYAKARSNFNFLNLAQNLSGRRSRKTIAL